MAVVTYTYMYIANVHTLFNIEESNARFYVYTKLFLHWVMYNIPVDGFMEWIRLWSERKNEGWCDGSVLRLGKSRGMK